MSFASVLLPLPLQGTFTYRVPEALQDEVKPGFRVVVPFGRRKFYTGIVTGLTDRRPEGLSDFKDIERVLDDKPVIRHPQLKFWQWIADYYLCTVGEVYRAALPTGLKVESETFVEAVDDFEERADLRLSEREAIVYSHLLNATEKSTLANLQKTTGIGAISHIVASLLDKGAVRVAENLVERYRPRTETLVVPAFARGDNDALHRAFDTVKRSQGQQRALLALLELSAYMQAGREAADVTRRQLMEKAGVSTAVVKAMADKGILNIVKRSRSRFEAPAGDVQPMPRLSEAQDKALRGIHASLKERDITLLHGVTSSGKTEIYARLADFVLRQKRQVLYLVPEIALTTQLTERLQRWFGDRVVIYHSRFSDNERVELWRRLLDTSEPLLVLGARSAVFLPFASLGLVIVDEEHEPSYKQQDPAPRYNGRDAALMLARMHGAKAVLGSATPAVDTYYKAREGRYGLVSLTTRYSDAPLPDIRLVDTSKGPQQAEAAILAPVVQDAVTEALANGRQAILFLNRRGYAPVARCSVCGTVSKCRHCDVSLTYHKRLDRLVCHYCGTPYPVPRVCPACGEPAMSVRGHGTERVHEEIEPLFPGTAVARMDLDTTRNKDAYQHIIDDFSEGRSRILVGTQMVTKGLDFAGVSVVGVIGADNLLAMPDFRSLERAFNMLCQVAGRAGRRADAPRGQVFIQTRQPSHPVLEAVAARDYEAFYLAELEERRLFLYPPFTRIVYIMLRSPHEDTVQTASAALASRLRGLFGNRIFGPDTPPVARVKAQYIRRIMIKMEVNASMTKVKAILRDAVVDLVVNGRYPSLTVAFDVDPA